MNTFSVTFDNAKLAGHTVLVDWDALSGEAQSHFILFGIRQCLSDAVAGMSVDKGDSIDDMRQAVNEKLQRIIAGEFGGGGGRIGDPIMKEMRALATLEVNTQAKANKAAFKAVAAKQGFNWDDDKSKAKFLAAVVKAHVVKHDARLRAKAEAIVAERRAETAGVELDSLFAEAAE